MASAETIATHVTDDGREWAIHFDGHWYWAENFPYEERTLEGMRSCLDWWTHQWSCFELRRA